MKKVTKNIFKACAILLLAAGAAMPMTAAEPAAQQPITYQGGQIIEVGDTVRIHNKIVEGTRERIQLFEGTIIAKHGGGISETFTVRRISYGVGVEKTFPVHSPNVVKVDIIRSGKVRRAKLYYIRKKVGKASKIKEQIV